MIEVVWHGHACFELRCERRSLVIDPHDGHSIGVSAPSARADIAVVTHDHFDHTAVRAVEKVHGGTRTLWMPDGTVDVGAFQVSGHPAYHDDAQGRLRGEVRLIMVECGGLRLLHLSDVGHELDAATVAAVGRPDVAFVPAGGVFTWEPEAAWRTIARLSPRVVVPMHYKASGLALPLHDLQWFVGDRPTVSLGRVLEVDADDLPAATEIWRFDR